MQEAGTLFCAGLLHYCSLFFRSLICFWICIALRRICIRSRSSGSYKSVSSSRSMRPMRSNNVLRCTYRAAEVRVMLMF